MSPIIDYISNGDTDTYANRETERKRGLQTHRSETVIFFIYLVRIITKITADFKFCIWPRYLLVLTQKNATYH